MSDGCSGKYLRQTRLPAAAPPTHDRAVLGGLRSLMGNDWIVAALMRLKAGLDPLLGPCPATQAENSELRRHAHRIAGEAGQLGFAALSLCCGELESACRRGRDVTAPFATARRAAGLCREAIDGLLTAEAPVSAPH